MKYILKNIRINLIIIVLLISTIFFVCSIPIIKNIFDWQDNSFILMTSYVVTFLYIAIFSYTKSIHIHVGDILFYSIYFYSFINHTYDSNMIILSNICLIFCFTTFRLMPQVNYRAICYSLLLLLVSLSITGYVQYRNIISTDQDIIVTGIYKNPAFLGGILGFLISYTCPLIILSPKLTARHVLIIGLLSISLPIFFLTYSRASWLSLIISIIYLVFKRGTISHKFFHYRNLFIGFIGLLLIIAFYFIKQQSADGRVFIWKTSISMIKEKPILGWGHNGFKANYLDFQEKYFKAGHANKTEYYLSNNIHNTYNEPIRIIIEYGILGFILYLLLIWYVIKIKAKSTLAISCKASLLFYFIFGLFSFPDEIFPLRLLMIFSLAVFFNEIENKVYCYNLSRKYYYSFSFAFIALFVWINVDQHLLYEKIYNLFQSSSCNKNKQLESISSRVSNDYQFRISYAILLDQWHSNGRQNNANILRKIYPSSILYIQLGDYLLEQKNMRKQKVYIGMLII